MSIEKKYHTSSSNASPSHNPPFPPGGEGKGEDFGIIYEV
jgi:hypothetical protein